MKILLVEPKFPIPTKSKNHKDFLPIGLLKIAAYLRRNNIKFRLIRGYLQNNNRKNEIIRFNPDEIWITSLFTYWAEYVKNAVQYYKKQFPNAKIKVGGIYASLRPIKEVMEYTGCDSVYQGVFPEAEKLPPAYYLIKNVNPHPIDYQILHTSRGCERRCAFCGTWKIESEFVSKSSIKNEIKFNKLVFYDNNMLMNPHIEDILNELIELKASKKIRWIESQSGFDGRILLENPHLGKMLKEAGFRYPRIAWDGKYLLHKSIKKQLDIFLDAGYSSKELYVFVLYNWDISFKDMEKKRMKCWEWKVQISDCRFRPLDQLFDRYNPRKIGQTVNDYYIHEKKSWKDAHVKQFRKNIRRQNICVRHGFPIYCKELERFEIDYNKVLTFNEFKTNEEKIMFLKKIGISIWNPQKITFPPNELLTGIHNSIKLN